MLDTQKHISIAMNATSAFYIYPVIRSVYGDFQLFRAGPVRSNGFHGVGDTHRRCRARLSIAHMLRVCVHAHASRHARECVRRTRGLNKLVRVCVLARGNRTDLARVAAVSDLYSMNGESDSDRATAAAAAAAAVGAVQQIYV